MRGKFKFLPILILVLILLTHTFILKNLIFFPYPELFIYPYLTNNGLKPYQDILDQHFPGLMFLPINFDNLGMTNPFIARIWSIVNVLIIQVLLYLIGRKIFKSNSKPLLINLLYLIWQPFFEGWVLWIDNFLPLFLLPAFYFLLKFFDDKRGKLLFLVGLFLGLGIVFKQVLIPLSILLFIYLFFSVKNNKTLFSYCLGVILPGVLMLIYLFSIGVFADFFYWSVIFNLTIYAHHGSRIAPSFSHLIRVGIVYACALLAFLNKDKRLLYLLTIFIIGSIAGALARFDFVHFQPSLPFITIATAVGFYELVKLKQVKYVLLSYFALALYWLTPFYKGNISEKIYFFDTDTLVLSEKIKDLTEEGDKTFIFGPPPHIYQITKTVPAGNVFVFQFPWFLQVAEDRVLTGLIKDKPEIIVSERELEIEGEKIKDFAPKIDQYIQSNYVEVDKVNSVKILRKLPN